MFADCRMADRSVWSWFGLVVILITHLKDTALSQDDTLMTWERDVNYDDVIPDAANIPAISIRGSINCAVECQRHLWCNSFFYHHLNKQCSLQRHVYLSGMNVTSKTGLRYYRLKSESCPFEDGYVIDRLTSTCYRAVETPRVVWYDAINNCSAVGEGLAILDPVEKLDFVINQLLVNKEVYIIQKCFLVGMSRPVANWNMPYPGGVSDLQWLNGQPVNFTATAPYWYPGEPDNEYNRDNIVCLKPQFDYKLSDRGSVYSKKRSYVCEKQFDG